MTQPAEHNSAGGPGCAGVRGRLLRGVVRRRGGYAQRAAPRGHYVRGLWNENKQYGMERW